MKKGLIVTLCFCFLLIGINLSIQAQTEKPRPSNSNATGSRNSDQEELKGPVRRVRIETVQVLVKNGNFVEGPRVLRGIATYDQKGIKIDSVSYAQEETTPPGKQQYRYDDNGNTVLIGDDGSILSTVLCKYEQLDELGNWKRKISAIAVYENGILRYEPIEVTYRTITYYYGQAVEKFALAVTKAHASDSFIPTVTVSTPAPALTMATSDNTTTTDPTRSTRDERGIREEGESRSIDSKVANAGANDLSAVVPTKQEDQRVVAGGIAIKGESRSIDSKVANSGANNLSALVPTKQEEQRVVAGGIAIKTARTPTSPANDTIASLEKPTLKHVSEKFLRDAAINLPPPDYPPSAWRERTARKVEVQIIVDEEGLVGSAQVISGDSVLNDAAERAARNARFLPAKLSSDSAKVFGVISYDFAAPASTPPSVPASKTSMEVSPSKPPVENKNAKSDENRSAVISSEPSATVPVPAKTTDSLKPAVPSLYEKGLGYLAAGRHAEAVEALKQSVKLNPNDAIAYVKLGIAHSALAQYKEAVDVLKVAIRMKPGVVDALGFYHLGLAYNGLDRPADALEAFKRALYITRAEAVDPALEKVAGAISIVDLHYNLGLSYHKLARYDSAIKELKDVVKLDPKVAEAYYGLGMAYLALHNTTSAQQQEAPLRSLNPALASKLKDAIAVLPPCRTIDCGLGARR